MSGHLQAIRLRIKSIKNTQQITKAMKMVSAVKLRRAQENILRMRPYALKLLSLMADMKETGRALHPLLENKKGTNVLLVVLTSDRGLCGGFNSGINKFAEKFYSENKAYYERLDFLFIGKKSRDYFKTRNISAVDTILNLAREVSYDLAQDIAQRLKNSFLKGEYDEIRIIYNEFKSAISQKVVSETVLPIDVSCSSFSRDDSFSKDMLFEPSPKAMIEGLIDRHFAVQMYRCLLESVAAEHGARMTAMENATKNADEMLDKMTLTFNKIRQASITTELTEITSGAEALKNS